MYTNADDSSCVRVLNLCGARVIGPIQTVSQSSFQSRKLPHKVFQSRLDWTRVIFSLQTFHFTLSILLCFSYLSNSTILRCFLLNQNNNSGKDELACRGMYEEAVFRGCVFVFFKIPANWLIFFKSAWLLIRIYSKQWANVQKSRRIQKATPFVIFSLSLSTLPFYTGAGWPRNSSNILYAYWIMQTFRPFTS